ncbi:MAG: c-type cytochrome [Verrucomicrobiales bacterium]|nr:c-type cytochrome [Verrucomicrobiales bacterium]
MRLLWISLFLAAASAVKAQPVAEASAESPWADWIEPDFPFFSSVLDCRDLGEGFPKDNLVPRGLILNLGNDVWACYDVDLCRIALVWKAEPGQPPITLNALAPGSYHVAGQKTKDGQENLPKPVGTPLLVNGVYPGWQWGSKPVLKDPRSSAPSPEEVGRGGLGEAGAEFVGIDFKEGRVELIARLGTVRTTTGFDWRREEDGESARLQVQASLVGGEQPLDSERSLSLVLGREVAESGALGELRVVKFELPQGKVVGRTVQVSIGKIKAAAVPSTPKGDWRASVELKPELQKDPKTAYAIDQISLPVPNPWKRNVRLADIDFLDDQGNAVAVTMDGDVWKVSGLTADLQAVTWRRFTSGLHEPMSIVVKDGEPFVFDRNGIWKIVDQDGDGVADRHEMFCNLFAQTAETREFPMSMKPGPEGALFISKGGQEGTTRGKHNGTVIRVAPDGKSFAVLGYGLRQPFIGVNPETGLVTASDQQGHYVPSTPIDIIQGHHFYGHLPSIAEPEKYPESIEEPMVWIPHPVNSSGATQVWALDDRFGPVAGEMIHVGYNRPELFRVVMNPRFKRPQAAVMSFTRDLHFGPLNAKMNPADGQLYVAGFQIWGTTAKDLSGLVRVRYAGGERPLVKEVTPTDKGVLLRFNMELDPKTAGNPDNYNAERWNYKRTPQYGSPHLKLDGSPGQEWMTASSAYLSTDGKSVLVGFPDMKGEVDQMRIGWGIQTKGGIKAQNTAYFSPWELAPFDPVKEGFGEIEVDLTPRREAAQTQIAASKEEGERVYQMFGCMACHSIDGTLQGKVGPSWKGLFGSERDIAKQGKVKADEAYLKESILNPSAKVVKGFEKFDTGMPIYSGILNDGQIDSLILYIKSLADQP